MFSDGVIAGHAHHSSFMAHRLTVWRLQSIVRVRGFDAIIWYAFSSPFEQHLGRPAFDNGNVELRSQGQHVQWLHCKYTVVDSRASEIGRSLVHPNSNGSRCMIDKARLIVSISSFFTPCSCLSLAFRLPRTFRPTHTSAPNTYFTLLSKTNINTTTPGVLTREAFRNGRRLSQHPNSLRLRELQI